MRWLLAILVGWGLWAVAAQAQSPELLAAAKRSNALYVEGRYPEALGFAEQALTLSVRDFGPDHPNTAIFLGNLAEVLQVQGRYAEAEPLCERALAIWQKAFVEHTVADTGLNDRRRRACDLAALGVFSRYPD